MSKIFGIFYFTILICSQSLSAQTPTPQATKPPLEVFPTLLGARCNNGTIWLQLNTIATNISDQPVVLRKDALQNIQARFAATEADILAGRYEKLTMVSISLSKQVDFSDNAYITLPPSVSTGHDQEYPITGLDLKGKKAAQFIYFTWPTGKKDQAASERTRLTQTGDLFVDDLLSRQI